MTAIIILFAMVLGIYVVTGLLFVMGLFMPASQRNAVRPFVSVIIAARNEEQSIPDCLNSVLNQTYPSDLFEIIVVDDRSNDRTPEIIRDLTKRNPSVKLIQIKEKPENISGKKNALEQGIKASRGEILLFTDADCGVKITWIEGIVKYFTKDVGLVIGASFTRGATWFERQQSFDFAAMKAAACGITNLGLPFAASGQNLAYRRVAFDEAGGFEKIRHRISGDDVLMMQLIRQLKKWKIVFAGDAGTFNSTRSEPTLSAFIHQRARWASNTEMMLTMSPLFFTYLVSVYGLNVFLAGGLIWGIWNKLMLGLVVFGWINKLIIDFLVTYLGFQKFQKPFSFSFFLTWFFLQAPYVLWVGLQGGLRLFKWK
ncbi:glycosyltransferase [bacterium]|nr:glycosyltransferase [bacterium]